MPPFQGFTSSETFTRIPDSFVQLLKEIEDAAELKVCLFALWSYEHMEGDFRALEEADFEPQALGLAAEKVRSGLAKSVQRGVLIHAARGPQALYFLNSPRGRLAAESFRSGGQPDSARPAGAARVRPNVYKLYEENIGPLTPLIADALKEAEADYPPEWVSAAVERAVRNNKRSWKYIEAILKRWKEEGRAEKQDRRDDQTDHQQSLRRKVEQLRKRAGE